jgi:hypothetical protein
MAPQTFPCRTRRFLLRRALLLSGVALWASSALLSCTDGAQGGSGKAFSGSSLASLRVEPAKVVSSPAFPGRPLRVYGRGADGQDRELESGAVEFESSDPAIVAVSSSGDVLFLQPGRATIAVTSGGLEARVPVEIRTPPIALQVSKVSASDATIVMDKLPPGGKYRIFGTTDLDKGLTSVAECLRLDLRMKGATVLAEGQLPGNDTSFAEVVVPFPANAPPLALQVVTGDCAISPVVVAAAP